MTKPHHIVLLLTLIGFSCNQEPVINPGLKIYAEMVQEQGKRRNVDFEIDYDIVFGSVQNGKTAVCKRSVFSREIRINESRWSQIDESTRLFVMAHEIGHCSFNLEHNNKKLPSSQCTSLMSSSARENMVCWMDMYSDHWINYYFDQFFGVASADFKGFEPYNSQMDSVVRIKSYTQNKFTTDISHLLNHKDLEITVSFDQRPVEGFSKLVNWNGIGLNYNRINNELVITASGTSHNQQAFFRKRINKLPAVPFTVSVLRQDDLLYFYLNEQLLHSVSDTYQNQSGRLSTARSSYPFLHQITLSIASD